MQGVGIDSAEVGNPPGKFKDVFVRARELNLHCVAHAGAVVFLFRNPLRCCLWFILTGSVWCFR